MTDPAPTFAAFLGAWQLIPASCVYEQGEPPRSGSYEISEDGATLVFSMRWEDAMGEHHHLSFSGRPDGEAAPYEAGELADSLSVSAVSTRELNTSAYLRGEEIMVAQRQLDDTLMAMRITQVVRLVGGTSLFNTSVYRRFMAIHERPNFG